MSDASSHFANTIATTDLRQNWMLKTSAVEDERCVGYRVGFGLASLGKRDFVDWVFVKWYEVVDLLF